MGLSIEALQSLHPKYLVPNIMLFIERLRLLKNVLSSLAGFMLSNLPSDLLHVKHLFYI